MNAYLTGCDDKQFDILSEWFLPKLVASTTKAIIIYDFGMTIPQRVELQKTIDRSYMTQVHIVDMSSDPWQSMVNRREGWFMKPAAIKHALLYGEHVDRAIWVDCDIEIRKSIDDAFDLIEDDRLLIVLDWHAQKNNPGMHNTGIVGAMTIPRNTLRNIPGLLTLWDDSCEHPEQRGDQEVLHQINEEWIAEDGLNRITTLPPHYQIQRLQIMAGCMMVDESTRAIHYTGPAGKNHIRKLMTR